MEKDFNISYDELKKVYESKNYRFFDSKRFNLNIFGIRNVGSEPNQFDDLIGIAFKDSRMNNKVVLFKATTDPGTFWLQNPMRVEGTAILVEGQYISSFKLGKHKGKYTALIQARPVKVYRDSNKDDRFDFDPNSIMEGFGINIHRASEFVIKKDVDKWSAGCQVIADVNDFIDFIALCETQKQLYGNSFTYTLFRIEDFNV